MLGGEPGNKASLLDLYKQNLQSYSMSLTVCIACMHGSTELDHLLCLVL